MFGCILMGCPGCEECFTKKDYEEFEKIREIEKQKDIKYQQEQKDLLLKWFKNLKEENKKSHKYSDIWIDSKIRKLEE